MADTSPITLAGDALAGATAAGALSAPWWFPVLKEASEVAAFLLPILGVILVSVQIVFYLIRLRRRRL
jgi:hypothetical protein